MKYTPVGINAPTLDNSDECKFIRNENLLYATAGDESSGPTANLVLYEKLVDTGCHHLYDSPDISRNTFKTGTWGMPENGIDKPWEGGDYYLGAFTHIKTNLFRAGKLNKLRFRFFTKDSYNTENPQLLIPNTGSITDKEELWAFLNNKSENPALPTKVVFLKPHIVDGTQNGWDFGAFAKLDLDNLPVSNDDWYNFILEDDFYITSEMLQKLNYSFAIVILPNATNWSSKNNNKNVNDFFNNSKVFSGGYLRGAVGTGDSDNVVAMRSVPRGSLDGITYLYAPTTSTSDGTADGQNRLLELEYCIDTDLVDEYLGENADKHHLDIKEVQELNTLRYSAPLRPDNHWEVVNAAVNRIFISDESLKKFNNVNLDGKSVTSIRIPFKLRSAEKYLVPDMLNNQLLSRSGGLCHTNRDMLISLDGGQTKIRSTNFLAYSYFDEMMIYEWYFESDDIEALKYKGQGIEITGERPLGDSVGYSTLAVELYKKDNNFYAYSQNDIIDSTNGNYRNINATAGIKVMFNYLQRGEWFDYVENTQNELITIVNNTANNELTNILNIVKTYENFKNDRIKFKWAEFCESHSTPLKGVLKEVKVIMSHNQWTNYDSEVRLCIYEESENSFIKKAVSTNSLIPRKSTTETWYFENVELTGKTIRVGLIDNEDGILHELGDNNPTNPSLQTNAITPGEGYDGECYVCNDSGVRQSFGCPMEFTFLHNILQDINVIENNINNIVENNNTVIQNILKDNSEHFENTEIHVTQEDKDRWNSIFNTDNEGGEDDDNPNVAINLQQINLGKWRIYVNDNGSLVIDTESLAAAGKSIVFNDIQL